MVQAAAIQEQAKRLQSEIEMQLKQDAKTREHTTMLELRNIEEDKEIHDRAIQRKVAERNEALVQQELRLKQEEIAVSSLVNKMLGEPAKLNGAPNALTAGAPYVMNGAGMRVVAVIRGENGGLGIGFSMVFEDHVGDKDRQDGVTVC